MQYTAKEKWAAFFKSLWTPMIYILLQLVVGFFVFFPMMTYAFSLMIRNIDDIASITDELENIALSPELINMTMLLTAMSGILMTVYMVFYYRKKKGISYASLGINDLKPKSAILGALLGIGTMLTIVLALNLLDQFVNISSSDTTSNMIAEASPLWAMTATVCVAPIVEEFIMRGFVFERLSKVFSARTTVVLTALIFGLIHFNLVQSSYAFVAGLSVGYFRAKYDDLWGCMLFHIFGNFCGSFDFGVFGENAYLIACISGVVILVAVLVFMLIDKEKGLFKKEEPVAIATALE